MCSGKTTVAEYFVSNHGYTRVTLAAPIKEIVNAIDSMNNINIAKKFIDPYYKLHGSKRSRLYRILDATRTIPHEFPKPRKRLQFLGTDGVRKNIDDRFWLKVLWERYRDHGKIVIDDCRFLNEYEFFVAQGFNDIKLCVTEKTQDDRLLELYGPYDREILEHPSETEQDKVFSEHPDNIIHNDGTLEELYEALEDYTTTMSNEE